MKTFLAAVGMLLCAAASARAEIKTEVVEYKQGDATLKGFLAYDDSSDAKRPGVMVSPEWWGLNDYIKSRAKQLAQLGYVAFAADIYGNGATTSDADEAGKLMGKFRNDRALLRERAAAALEQLKKNPRVDAGKLAAIGYCFGGMTVLEMARGGMDLRGIVSFHGALDTPGPAEPGKVKAAVLVCHGGADPLVTDKDVVALMDELRKANVADWQVHVYSGAKHAFTNPDVDKLNMPPVAYNKRADEQSWQDMKEFFERVLK